MGLFDRVRDAVGNGGESTRDGGEPTRDAGEPTRDDATSTRESGGPDGGPDDHPPTDGAAVLPDESRDGQRELAAELVDRWSGYELDYSPASLAALDALVADEYDESPGGVDRDARIRESPPGELPEDASVRVAGGGDDARIAAYLGEVFCRSYRAVWRSDPALDAVAVAVDSGRAEFQPAALVGGAFQGHVSFERFHDALAEDHGLATDAS